MESLPFWLGQVRIGRDETSGDPSAVLVHCHICGAEDRTTLPSMERHYLVAAAGRLSRYKCPENGHGVMW